MDMKPVQIPSLSRGRACITCRRKKMRCDGARPFCGPCSLTRNPSHCEYTDKQGRTFTEVLEERLRLLKSRLKELEDRQEDAPVLLRNPYVSLQDDSDATDAHLMNSPARLSGAFNLGLQQHEVSPTTQEQSNVAQVDQVYDFSTLLDNFLPHVQRLHFVLHIPTFRQGVGRPMNDPLRPHASLISAVALWALRIMGPHDEYAIHESYHLKASLDALPAAHSSAISLYRIHAIQAEVLLALYFFNDSRVIKGRYHLAAAVAAALACGLQRIVASQEPPTLPASGGLVHALSVGGAHSLCLDAPRDSLELGERINLFWSVYSLDRFWSVALGSAPGITDNSSPGALIQCPTPMPLDYYRDLSIQEMLHSAELSTCSFLKGSADYSTLSQSSSVSAPIAAVLFEGATRLAGIFNANDAPSGINTLADVEVLGQSIRKFTEALKQSGPLVSSPTSRTSSPIDNAPRGEARIRNFALSLGSAAMIQLQYPFLGNAEADAHCRSAVREIIRVIKSDSELSQGQLDKVDFFLGIVWLSAARVLINELAVLSSAPPTPGDNQINVEASSSRPSTSVSAAGNESTQEVHQQLASTLRAQEISEQLDILLRTIRNLGNTCPLISFQLGYLEGLIQN